MQSTSKNIAPLLPPLNQKGPSCHAPNGSRNRNSSGGSRLPETKPVSIKWKPLANGESIPALSKIGNLAATNPAASPASNSKSCSTGSLDLRPPENEEESGQLQRQPLLRRPTPQYQALIELEDAVGQAAAMLDLLSAKLAEEERQGLNNHIPPRWVSAVAILEVHVEMNLRAKFKSLSNAIGISCGD